MLATPGRGEAGDSMDSGGNISLDKFPDVTLLYLQSNSSHSSLHSIGIGYILYIRWD